MRIGQSECQKCPPQAINTIRVLGFILLIMGIILLCIWFNIRKKVESEASIIYRIFTNYLHCISASVSFNITYPSVLTNTMNPLNKIGQSSDTFLSFDCFIEDLQLNIFNNSEYILKSFLSFFLPIIIIAIFIVLYGVIKLINKKSDFKRNSSMGVITVLFFMHPTLTQKAIAFFRCTTVDEVPRLVYDFEVVCGETTHLSWCLLVAVPVIVVWSIGLPAFGIYFIVKNRHNLQTKKFEAKYLILY